MFVIGSMKRTLAKLVNADWSWNMATAESYCSMFLIFEIE
jgi:hypothetical protein